MDSVLIHKGILGSLFTYRIGHRTLGVSKQEILDPQLFWPTAVINIDEISLSSTATTTIALSKDINANCISGGSSTDVNANRVSNGFATRSSNIPTDSCTEGNVEQSEQQNRNFQKMNHFGRGEGQNHCRQ